MDLVLASLNRHNMMSTQPRIAIVLDPWERETFLPAAVIRELESISTDLHSVEPGSLEGATAWIDWLAETAPEILVSGWMTPALPEDTLERVPELKYVCHLAGSVKGTVSNGLLEQGLLVSNWGNSVARTVAECGLMLAIASLRRVSHWSIQMHRHGGWKVRESVGTGSLFGRKVGLHGFGVIARELTRLLEPFKVPVMTYSPSVPDTLLTEYGVERAPDLETLFSHNDVIVELAALTERNRGMVTERLLRSIPAGGAFVNIGRGAVVDEAALARVARDGHIRVALDVYEKEPLPEDSPLRGLDEVVLLPHLGGPTEDRRQDAAWFGLDNIRRYLDGMPLEAQVTPEVYQRTT